MVAGITACSCYSSGIAAAVVAAIFVVAVVLSSMVGGSGINRAYNMK